MFRPRMLRLAAVVALTGASTFLARSANAQSSNSDTVTLPYSAATPNCVVNLDPVLPGEASSHVTVVGCYATFAEAVSAGTGGTVQLPASAAPSTLTPRRLAAKLRHRRGAFSDKDCTPNCTGTIIGIDYHDANWLGSILMYTTNNSAGCTGGANYYWSSLPAGWDNVISSARSYTGCEYFHHWVNTGFSGGQIICDWTLANFGALNDTTSSVGLKKSS
jgi:hypothetical protein